METKMPDNEGPSIKGPAARMQSNKPSASVVREEGRSLLPISRVQRIIKADKDLPIVAKEAVFAISIAAEEFIKRVTAASQRQAERENRTTVQRKDLATVAARADEFFFLEDILVWPQEEKPLIIKKTNRKAKVVSGTESSNLLVSNDTAEPRTP